MIKINTPDFISAKFFMKDESPEFDSLPVIMPSQVHGSEIIIIDDDNYLFPERPQADGILLKTRKASAALRFADCAPVMIWPEDNNNSEWVMMLHSGYKGTVLNISGKGVGLSNSRNLHAWVGPCIGFEDYMRDLNNDEWTQKGLETFHEGNYRLSGDKVYFDLADEIKSQLLDSGLKDSNIIMSGINTFRDSKCCSYRRGDVKERMTLYARIK
ncbi:MAG: polyphenol oxidase family protein [Synergistaceae bacterium]|nr:polyphenol oxidase family protein [Synergistaceae bacterium]MBR0203963.1 polyphenol oxidase family protein [Synergistaceae bacterium]